MMQQNSQNFTFTKDGRHSLMPFVSGIQQNTQKFTSTTDGMLNPTNRMPYVGGVQQNSQTFTFTSDGKFIPKNCVPSVGGVQQNTQSLSFATDGMLNSMNLMPGVSGVLIPVNPIPCVGGMLIPITPVQVVNSEPFIATLNQTQTLLQPHGIGNVLMKSDKTTSTEDKVKPVGSMHPCIQSINGVNNLVNTSQPCSTMIISGQKTDGVNFNVEKNPSKFVGLLSMPGTNLAVYAKAKYQQRPVVHVTGMKRQTELFIEVGKILKEQKHLKSSTNSVQVNSASEITNKEEQKQKSSTNSAQVSSASEITKKEEQKHLKSSTNSAQVSSASEITKQPASSLTGCIFEQNNSNVSDGTVDQSCTRTVICDKSNENLSTPPVQKCSKELPVMQSDKSNENASIPPVQKCSKVVPLMQTEFHNKEYNNETNKNKYSLSKIRKIMPKIPTTVSSPSNGLQFDNQIQFPVLNSVGFPSRDSFKQSNNIIFSSASLTTAQDCTNTENAKNTSKVAVATYEQSACPSQDICIEDEISLLSNNCSKNKPVTFTDHTSDSDKCNNTKRLNSASISIKQEFREEQVLSMTEQHRITFDLVKKIKIEPVDYEEECTVSEQHMDDKISIKEEKNTLSQDSHTGINPELQTKDLNITESLKDDKQSNCRESATIGKYACMNGNSNPTAGGKYGVKESSQNKISDIPKAVSSVVGSNEDRFFGQNFSTCSSANKNQLDLNSHNMDSSDPDIICIGVYGVKSESKSCDILSNSKECDSRRTKERVKNESSSPGNQGCNSSQKKHSRRMKYSCTTCRRTFQSHKEYLLHDLSHSSNGTFKCSECEQKFSSKNIKFPNKCPSCVRRILQRCWARPLENISTALFEEPAKLRIGEINPSEIQTRNRTSDFVSSFTVSQKISGCNSKSDFLCKQCGNKFGSVAAFNNHIPLFHYSEYMSWKSPLRLYLNMTSDENDQYFCNNCEIGEIFNSHEDLLNHINTKHDCLILPQLLCKIS